MGWSATARIDVSRLRRVSNPIQLVVGRLRNLLGNHGLDQRVPWFFALWGIPFVLVGLYLIVGRFWVDQRQRENTVYAVTSERVFIRSGLFSKRTKSLSIDTVSDVSLSEQSNGAGFITFGPVPPFIAWMNGASWPGFGHQSVPSFELASDARKVYEIVRGAQRAAKQRV